MVISGSIKNIAVLSFQGLEGIAVEVRGLFSEKT